MSINHSEQYKLSKFPLSRTIHNSYIAKHRTNTFMYIFVSMYLFIFKQERPGLLILPSRTNLLPRLVQPNWYATLPHLY